MVSRQSLYYFSYPRFSRSSKLRRDFTFFPECRSNVPEDSPSCTEERGKREKRRLASARDTMVDHGAIAIAIISIRRVGTLVVVARLMYPASVPVSCSPPLDIPRGALARVCTRVSYRADIIAADSPLAIKLSQPRSSFRFLLGSFLTFLDHSPLTRLSSRLQLAFGETGCV